MQKTAAVRSPSGRKQYTVRVLLDNYIAHPMWPEQGKLINITKESGMSRARSDANRAKALEEYLKRKDMTMADFHELERLAARPFYTAEDGEIIVPKLHVISMIVATCDTMRAAGRPLPPDQVRAAIRVSDWSTGRHKADGTYDRFAVVTAGTGARLSNQRALRSNEYIGTSPDDIDNAAEPGVTCTGSIYMKPSWTTPGRCADAPESGGENIGIGSGRKMGWGRFEILEFTG